MQTISWMFYDVLCFVVRAARCVKNPPTYFFSPESMSHRDLWPPTNITQRIRVQLNPRRRGGDQQKHNSDSKTCFYLDTRQKRFEFIDWKLDSDEVRLDRFWFRFEGLTGFELWALRRFSKSNLFVVLKQEKKVSRLQGFEGEVIKSKRRMRKWSLIGLSWRKEALMKPLKPHLDRTEPGHTLRGEENRTLNSPVLLFESELLPWSRTSQETHMSHIVANTHTRTFTHTFTQ